MKKILVILFSIFSLTSYSQILEPVSWEFSQKQITEDIVELKFQANIEDHWKLYSQFISSDGPTPTYFDFEQSNFYQKVGTTKESESIQSFDPVWEISLNYFENKATFKQQIKILKKDPFSVKGVIDYIACDSVQCFFPLFLPEFDFNIKLRKDFANEKGVLGCTDESQSNYNPEATLDDGSCYLLGCTDSTANNYNPEATKLDNSCKYFRQGAHKYNDPLVDLNNPIANCGNQKEEESNTLWGIFILGLLGGLIALITPCVFPMIPLTVSFFTKGKKEKGIYNAIVYGFFIMLIYFLLSIPFHIMPNIDPEILNQISTNTWLNILFFLIFMAFAFSFFGYYELTLPSKWGNKADSGSNFGGLIGIFFMALTLAIVSFSCTGPILGTLLAGTLGGDVSTLTFLGLELKMVATKLTVGMTGFGLALGFPFALFALFPRLLDSLPQSGGWLNSVKVVLGFLEVALAIKFLSNADMVEQWGLIKRETYFFLWFLVGIMTILYLLGKIKFPHDSPIKQISKTRYAFIAFFTAFTIYLIPGIFGSHVNWWEHKLLSGFPPPLTYSYTYEEEQVFHDYWEAIEYSKKVNKPVFVDFTGWNCTNCRDMEENIFPEVKDLLDQYVICQLYVDERSELSETEMVILPTKDGGKRKKELTTIGDKWSTLQVITYQNSSQPHYVLYSFKDGLLTYPLGYTSDVEDFAEWLKCGLESF